MINLPFAKQSKWIDLDIEKGHIKLRQLYGNSKHTRIHALFNLKTVEDLIYWVIIEDFEELKRISIEAQHKFYIKLINEKSKYKKCCPEYIKQANEFLVKDKNEFKSMVDLAIEMYIKRRTIVLKGLFKNGDPFQLVLVQKT